MFSLLKLVVMLIGAYVPTSLIELAEGRHDQWSVPG